MERASGVPRRVHADTLRTPTHKRMDEGGDCAALMAGLVNNYIEIAQVTGTQPNLELLLPILEVFARLKSDPK